MKIQTVTLEQVLSARDRRAQIQSNMLGREGADALVCLTLNIAGEIKRTVLTGLLFRRGTEAFDRLGLDVMEQQFLDGPAGSEAFWLVRGDAEEIKRKLEAVEESYPAARLFDFDVLVPNVPAENGGGIIPVKLSRATARSCLICGRPAAECARSRAHGLEAVREVTWDLLRGSCAQTLSDAAYDSLLDELYTTPKPGLVDLADCGAHTDMDVPLFEKSARSLRPYFRDAAMLGMAGCSMKELRQRGLKAEEEMFEATGGINTHKGLIYSMGLLLAGMGRAVAGAERGRIISEEELSRAAVRFASELARQDAGEMLSKSLADPKTNGAKVLRDHGAKGASGEAQAGFPGALYCESRLKNYRETEHGDCSADDVASDTADVHCLTGVASDTADVHCLAGVLAFCDSMARLEDTNLLYRGGEAGLSFARSEARRISEIRDAGGRIRELAALNKEMIRRGLSPGGSADMLALAFLLERWRKLAKTAISK